MANQDDYIDIGKDDEGNIVVDFGLKKINRITLSRDVAVHMALTMLKHTGQAAQFCDACRQRWFGQDTH